MVCNSIWERYPTLGPDTKFN